MFEMLQEYYDKSSAVTIIVLAVLSIYFIIVFWIFLYRYFYLNKLISTEEYSLKKLYTGRVKRVDDRSLLFPYINRVLIPNRAIFAVAKESAIREATSGLTTLAIIASTAPFIGLFGTVVSILETFSRLGTQKGSSIAIVAPAISEALVATAGGILVATFAYTFHLILKRKAYELSTLLDNQADLILAQKE